MLTELLLSQILGSSRTHMEVRLLGKDYWTARRQNLSILKEINPAYSLEGLMLKLKLQYYGLDSLEKILMLRKNEGRRRRGWQRMKWLDSITNSMDMNLSKLWEIVKDRGAWHIGVHGITKSQTQLRDLTATVSIVFLAMVPNFHIEIQLLSQCSLLFWVAVHLEAWNVGLNQ